MERLNFEFKRDGARRFRTRKGSETNVLRMMACSVVSVSPLTDQSCGFADLSLRSQVEQLSTPLWIFDIDRSRVVWANKAGLDVWDADTLVELSARDLGLDMSVSVATRLRQYQEDFERRGATFSELWTLYPKGKPKTLRVVYGGIKLPDGRVGMFCEATPYHAETPETPRSAEALLHANVMISLYDKLDQPLYRNPAARADGRPSETDSLALPDRRSSHCCQGPSLRWSALARDNGARV
jgi:hypothetical protein